MGQTKKIVPPGKKSNKKKFGILKICAILISMLVVLYWLIPLPNPLFKNDYSTVVIDERGNILRAFLNKNQQWYFPPDKNSKIPEKLKTCILGFEDKYFFYHPGFNPVSLIKAFTRNIFSGKIKSGASTISMQVVRLAAKKNRTIGNKILEILQSIKLECRYSKKEILKLYVTHAPYGGNIIGYQPAALKYFKKNPDQLTWSESAALAVLPNSPGLISPVVNRTHLIKKRNRLLKILMEKKIISHNAYRLSIQEPLPRKTSPFFLNAPHFSQAIKSRLNIESGFIHTTILKKHQIWVEDLLKQHLRFISPFGITNGAVLVVETQTGKVRVYAGSQNFFDDPNGGQNDGVISPRSTGSIIKPFLYAAAIDEGLILPQTRIKDIPSYFGSFSPSNANKKYSGLVTAREALIQSLNVPASRLLNTYGLNKFYLFLKSAGVTTLFRNADEYGLTLILGGAEATLLDLAKIYCGLGNYGKFIPLKMVYSKEAPNRQSDITLLSPEACYLTLNMLRDVKRPGSEFYWEHYQNQYPIAWKTGTSYGQKDGWSIGVTPEWTIAVWIGNFNGEGNPDLSGASCAAPLMFEIFNYLPRSFEKNWFQKSKLHLKSVKLCMDTGFVAGPYCSHTYWSEAPPTIRPFKICPYHKLIFTTLDEKTEVCSLCWKSGKYKKMTQLIFPPDVTQYLRESGTILSHIPPHQKNCPGHTEFSPLQIIYPVKNARLWIPYDFDRSLQKLTLTVAHSLKNQTVYWYLDNIYRGETKSKHKLAFEMKEGWHTLEVVDADGNRDRRKFYVMIRSTDQ